MEKCLKECPFCGADPTTKEFLISTMAEGTYIEQQILCSCGASGPISKWVRDAIAAWNRREPDWERKWEGLVETVGARIAQDDAQKKAKP